MNYLQYTSKEMYSSTDLIRKSKLIFDKLNKKEIEKAIILRDGKPSFMLLDFETYEEIMIDYIKLKQKESKSSNQTNHKNEVKEIKKDQEDTQEKETKDELDQDEVKKALEEIENLDFNLPTEENKKEQPLKEFWE